MKAVVYKSQSGFTRQFAEMFAEKVGLPCVELSQAKSSLQRGSQVVYFGWVMAGIVMGYRAARRKFDVVAVCPVGMATPDENVYQDIASHNKIDPEKLFVLQGGFDMKKLKGIYRFMMASMSKSVTAKLEAKTDKTEEDSLMLEMMRDGKNCVCEGQLSDVLEYYAEKQQD